MLQAQRYKFTLIGHVACVSHWADVFYALFFENCSSLNYYACSGLVNYFLIAAFWIHCGDHKHQLGQCHVGM